MKESNPFFATLAGILSSLLVVLGMVTCCGMPLLAGILAAVGVGCPAATEPSPARPE
ncbi:MAG: hypothetical protein ACRC46_14280 [Thermoguttaceae bacterium]